MFFNSIANKDRIHVYPIEYFDNVYQVSESNFEYLELGLEQSPKFPISFLSKILNGNDKIKSRN